MRVNGGLRLHGNDRGSCVISRTCYAFNASCSVHLGVSDGCVFIFGLGAAFCEHFDVFAIAKTDSSKLPRKMAHHQYSDYCGQFSRAVFCEPALPAQGLKGTVRCINVFLHPHLCSDILSLEPCQSKARRMLEGM